MMQQNNSNEVEDNLSKSSGEVASQNTLDEVKARWNLPTFNAVRAENSALNQPKNGSSAQTIPNNQGNPSQQERLYFDSYKNLRTSDERASFNIESVKSKFKRFLRVSSNFVLPLVFISDVLIYLAVRFRVVFVLTSVLAEVIANQFDNVKRFAVRKLFWGRGNVFKFAVQFVAGMLVVVTIALSGYRARITEAAKAEVLMARSQGYSKDLAAQYSSTKTVLTDDTTRYEQIEYIVKGGDSMSVIAEYHLVSVDAILWANDMTPYDVIRPGMVIKIPPGEGVLITVKDGDTLEKLSEKYKANPQTIIDHNHLTPPFTLASGQNLFLPGGSIEAPKPVKTSPIFTGVINTKTPGSTGTYTPINSNVDKFLAWPVSGGGRLTQCYSGYHNGVDIADKAGPTVIAAAPGVVTLAGCQSGNCPSGEVGGSGLAWTVIVDHGNGFSTVYGHISTGDIYVKNGDIVSRGQALGKMGQSGTAYGIHLHFMLVQSGTWKWQNPAPYMTTKICGY